MTRRELIRRIKAGAPAYAPIGVKNGKDWVYAELDTKALLLDVKLDPGMNKFYCDANEKPNSPIWFDVVPQE